MSTSNFTASLSAAPPQAREALRFLLTIALILIPFLFGFGILEAIAWRVGETWSMEHVAQWQGTNPDRMWRGGDGRSYLTYKIARVRLLQPQIIMLGQSRANFIFARMMKPYSFYNAALTAWTFDHYRRFLELITGAGYAPKALFFNFDYWMFNKEFDRSWDDRFYEQPATHWEDLKIIVDELVKEPGVLLPRLRAADNLKGIYAVRNGSGFRVDGTLDPLPTSADPQRLVNDGNTVGKPPPAFGPHFGDEQVAAFERLVALAKAKNIVMIGIQVPFYKKILDGLNNQEFAGDWREFRSDAGRSYFASKGIIFFDFADMSEYRDKPEDFVDSVHPADPVIEDIMHRVLSDPRVRAALPDLETGP
jgi:hypothetical protein